MPGHLAQGLDRTLKGWWLAVLALGACESTRPSADLGPIVLAGTYSETGRWAPTGQAMANGMRLAAQMLNEQGGIAERQVALVLVDDQSSEEVAVVQYEGYARTDHVHALLGPYGSPLTSAVIAAAEQAGKPFVATLAAAEGIWADRSREWAVQMLNPARTYMQGTVELAVQHGAATGAVVYEESLFTRSVAEGVHLAAQTHGLDIVLDMGYPTGGIDAAEAAALARDAGAEVLIGATYYADAVALTKALPAAEYMPRLVGLNAPATPTYVTDVGDLARCVAGNAIWVPAIRTSGFIASSDAFVARYEEAYGESPSYYGAAGFGALELVAEAIAVVSRDHGGFDAASVRDYLFSVESHTVLGQFNVQPLGHPDAGAQRALKALTVQWQDGPDGGLQQHVVHPPEAATAEPCFWGVGGARRSDCASTANLGAGSQCSPRRVYLWHLKQSD